MSKITKIAFSCYAVSDIRKARKFYEGILGLKTNNEFDGHGNAQYIEYAVGTGTLAIGCSPEWKPSQDGASVALEVDDFDGFVKKIKSKNARIKSGPHEFPGCSMVVVLDPDKNTVVIHRKKSKAEMRKEKSAKSKKESKK